MMTIVAQREKSVKWSDVLSENANNTSDHLTSIEISATLRFVKSDGTKSLLLLNKENQ
jgi:hypothetical protein